MAKKQSNHTAESVNVAEEVEVFLTETAFAGTEAVALVIEPAKPEVGEADATVVIETPAPVVAVSKTRVRRNAFQIAKDNLAILTSEIKALEAELAEKNAEYLEIKALFV